MVFCSKIPGTTILEKRNVLCQAITICLPAWIYSQRYLVYILTVKVSAILQGGVGIPFQADSLTTFRERAIQARALIELDAKEDPVHQVEVIREDNV